MSRKTFTKLEQSDDRPRTLTREGRVIGYLPDIGNDQGSLFMNGILRASVLRKALIGAVAVCALTAVTATPAIAAEIQTGVASSNVVTADAARTLAVIQADAAAKIAKRQASLTKAIARVTANKYLTNADRSAILGTLNADASGLTSLGAKIAADTDRAVAAEDFGKIFTSYRVYAVALPQAHYAAAADALTGTVIPKLNDAYTKLVSRLAASGKSTPALEATLADMKTQIDKATSSASGVAAAALAVTPAQYNSNHAVLSSVHASIVSAHSAARLARADAKTVVQALR
jgi:hypothetical protein